MPEPGPAGVGEQVVPGRAAPTARAAARRVAHLGLAVGDQRVQMPADGRRRQLQLGRDRGRGDRPLLHQQPGDGRAGATLGMPASAPAPASDAARAPATAAGSMAARALFTTPVLPISPRDRQSDPPTAGPGERAHRRTWSLPCGHGRAAGLGTPPPAPLHRGAAAGGRVPDDPRPGADPPPARAHRRPADGASARSAPARCPCRTRCSGCACSACPRATPPPPSPITYAGMGMLVLAWLWIGRMLRARGAVAPAPDRTQLARTGAAVGAAARAGAADVLPRRLQLPRAERDRWPAGSTRTSLGPAEALGVDDPLTRTHPHDLARHPRPVRPAVPDAGPRHHRADRQRRGRSACSRTACSRCCGVALIVWALPRLARRCGLDAGLVLWLGAANPLVLFHLVSGIHNEALMIGLMLVGLELGAARPGPRPACPARPAVRARRGGRRRWRAAVKLPALLALGLPRDGARPGGGAAGCATSPRWRPCWPRSRSRSSSCSASGTGLGLRLDRHAGHPERDPQLDVGVHRPGPARRPGRHPRRARRPHRHRADAHPRARRPGRRAAVPAAAAARAARAAGPGHRAGGRAGRGGAARAGGAPLVPAVGGDPAGRHPRDAAAPAGRAGRVGRARGHGAAHRAPTSSSGRSSCPWRSWPGSSSCWSRCSSCGASCASRSGRRGRCPSRPGSREPGGRPTSRSPRRRVPSGAALRRRRSATRRNRPAGYPAGVAGPPSRAGPRRRPHDSTRPPRLRP